MSHEVEQKLFEYLDQEFGVMALQSDMQEIEYIVRSENVGKTLSDLETERLAWSLETFTEATAISSLRKLESEIKEVEADLINRADPTEEYADCLMCLFDSAGRAGISVAAIAEAFAKKLEKNKSRIWVKNPDNSYSHVK